MFAAGTDEAKLAGFAEAGVDEVTLSLDTLPEAETLRALSLKRMVVGHTPHDGGISSACDGQVWRIDTGLSKYYGGPLQALEIRGNDAQVIRAP